MVRIKFYLYQNCNTGSYIYRLLIKNRLSANSELDDQSVLTVAVVEGSGILLARSVRPQATLSPITLFP
jgi:hypothetical protein